MARLENPLPYLSTPSSPRWTFVLGAWGDVLAACGNIQEVLQRTGQSKIGVVYYGLYPYVRDFLAAQPWCREALSLPPADEQTYHQIARLSGSRAQYRNEWLAPLLLGTGIDPDEVALTHLSHELLVASQVRRWGPAELPHAARRWVETLFVENLHLRELRQRGERPILLQPISLSSNSLDDHWPHWRSAIEWLLAETPHTLLLVGQGWDTTVLENRPRLINLVDKTPSMLEVFALAERCALSVATSNGLSIWTVVQQLPGLIALNRGIDGFAYQWVNQEPNRLVPAAAPLSLFQHFFRKFTGAESTLMAGEKCPLCAGSGVPVGWKEGFLLRECSCHGRLLLSAAPPYKHDFHCRDGEYFPTADQGERAAKETALATARVLRVHFPQTRRVLDLSAGTGELIAQLRLDGCSTLGYSESPAQVDRARALGRSVELRHPELVPINSFGPDLILFSQGLKRLADPINFLRQLREQVGRGIRLVIEMPEWGCLEGQVEWMGFRHIRPREFRVLYNETAARELFKRANLSLMGMYHPPLGETGRIVYLLKGT